MQPDINTRFITLIGTPLSQSFAARMQNRAYEAAGLNLCYFYTEADDSCLRPIIDGVRHMPSFIGAAITKPNKVKVMSCLDELDPLCVKMGACNTVVKLPDGSLKGYNTDGSGFLISLTEEAGVSVPGKHFFCLGAGGAGRAMCSILAYEGAEKIYVTDKFMESAQSLVNDINSRFAPIAEYVPYGAFDAVANCDVIINATGIGMGETIGRTPLPEEFIRPDQLYFDACYNPDKTQFLINAEKRGARILNGLGMSLYQGVVQIELWTGVRPPVDEMRKELIQILKENDWASAHRNSRIFNHESTL